MKYIIPFFVLFFLFSACTKKKQKEIAEDDEKTIQAYISSHNLTATRTDSGLYYVIDEVGTDPKLITEELIDNFLENQGINRYTGRLAEILKKGKEVEDKIAKVEEYHKAVKKIMKLKKESEK